jgi:hypothetical protein
MATIRPNDNAPADAVKYIFPLETFELAPDGEFQTEDRNTLAAAGSHPWLEVAPSDADELANDAPYVSRSVPYADDVLAAPNSVAFDTAAVEQALRNAATVEENRTAIEAGLDQGKEVEVADVAVTLAADEAQDEPATDEKATPRKRTAKDKE